MNKFFLCTILLPFLIRAEHLLVSLPWHNGSQIPIKYTCKGTNTSPEIRINSVPHGALSIGLIMEDPDAPDPEHPKKKWIHWILYNIPAEIQTIKENCTANLLHLKKISIGLNSWNQYNYGGPCPPVGKHRYFLKFYALDKKIVTEKLSEKELVVKMAGHIIDSVSIMGLYRKRQ